MKYLLLSLTVLISACSTVPAPEQPNSDWTTIKIPRLYIDLSDDKEIQTFRFVEDNSVITSIGWRGKSVTGPVFSYKITKDKIKIFDHKNTIIEELSLISSSPTSLTARRKSGKVGHYRILEQEAEQGAAANP